MHASRYDWPELNLPTTKKKKKKEKDNKQRSGDLFQFSFCQSPPTLPGGSEERGSKLSVFNICLYCRVNVYTTHAFPRRSLKTYQ